MSTINLNSPFYIWLDKKHRFLNFNTRKPVGNKVLWVWPVDPYNRVDAWRIGLEAVAMKASSIAIARLIGDWNLTLEDSYSLLINADLTPLMCAGLPVFMKTHYKLDFNDYIAGFIEARALVELPQHLQDNKDFMKEIEIRKAA